MKSGSPSEPNKKEKFLPLTEHFRFRQEAVFTLTFEDIEKIIGQPLCNSAHGRCDYWYRRGEKRISFCWLSNGYRIRTLNLQKQYVVFVRNEDMGEAVTIPGIFLNGRIPPAAKAEMEVMFEYIRKKYGL